MEHTSLGEARILSAQGQDLALFIVAGEHSGDALGAGLMAALNDGRRARIRYLGVGGPQMAAQGLISQFPIEEVAVMGIAAILRRLPTLLRRIHSTARAGCAALPNAVVIIDSPEFTHPIARRIRSRLPSVPIIDYVSPSVWAWRPGRARRMRAYIDHVLALLPFEPEAHLRLGGPPCTYVGHPLIERLAFIRSLDPAPLAQRLALSPQRPLLVVLPGSRSSEVRHLLEPFGEALARLLEILRRSFEVVIPAVDSVRGAIESGVKSWPIKPHLVAGEEDKWRAFKLARAALAASGTATLELGLAGTPMVVAYKVDAVMAPWLRRMITAPSIVLTNLVLAERAVPEFHQENVTDANLAAALAPLFEESAQRAAQTRALARLPAALKLPQGTPSEAAAGIVLHYAERGRGALPAPT